MSEHPAQTRLRRLWSENRPAVNGWIAVPSVISAEAMASAGWDSLTVDLQHGTSDYRDLLAVLPVIERAGITPMVRVPWLDEAAVMRALDAGAMGIIAPMIETADDARRLVHACRYPPEGGRSFGPIRARFAWGDGYAATANDRVMTFAMVETASAVRNLDAILAVEGLTGIYIGPSDLSLSHGFPPGFDKTEPEVLALIQDIQRRAAAAGRIAALHCGSAAYAARAIGWGMNLVTISSDARFVELGAKDTLAGFRAALDAG